ncbi:amino acid transporter [Exophiala viscosa]|uniref:amino acid transporter n=1 Tax=Exophiala viscosa TaxID=2486360 RepID=UPI002195D4D8|nr:amino acid transporter [Exophiala viscosa]
MDPDKTRRESNADDLELEAQGYQRAMPRRFSLLSLLSLSFALTASWNGFGSAIGTGLAEFSASGVLWTLIIAATMSWIVSLGMAELSSAYPNSGAQYYWSFRVAAPAWAPFASYVTAGWWLGNASVANFIAAMILAMVKITNTDYTIQPWHQYLIYAAILWLAAAINIFGSRFVPLFSNFILYFSLATLVATIITILGCAAPKFQKASWVFGDTTNSTGWDNKGLLFILCLLNNAYGFMGTDAGAHLAEEIPNPMVNVPKVIVMPVFIGLITTWPFALACLFVIVDVERVIAPPSGMPLIEIYYQATGSKAATIALLAAFAFCLFGCATANIAGSSRQIWAASRDNAFPGSRWWSQVSPRFQMPLNAAVLSAMVTMLYGLIFLGSSTAFASMVGANIVFMMTSYVIPQGILAWRGRAAVLPERHLNLGRWGIVVNVVSCVWCVFLDVVACIPVTRPVTTTNMNWVSVVMVGIGAYVLIAWCLWQRHVYKGPRVNVQLQDQIHREILHHEGRELTTTISGIELDDAIHDLGHKAVKAD